MAADDVEAGELNTADPVRKRRLFFTSPGFKLDKAKDPELPRGRDRCASPAPFLVRSRSRARSFERVNGDVLRFSLRDSLESPVFGSSQNGKQEAPATESRRQQSTVAVAGADQNGQEKVPAVRESLPRQPDTPVTRTGQSGQTSPIGLNIRTSQQESPVVKPLSQSPRHEIPVFATNEDLQQKGTEGKRISPPRKPRRQSSVASFPVEEYHQSDRDIQRQTVMAYLDRGLLPAAQPFLNLSIEEQGLRLLKLADEYQSQRTFKFNRFERLCILDLLNAQHNLTKLDEEIHYNKSGSFETVKEIHLGIQTYGEIHKPVRSK
jgi:hypothetical protein